MSKKLLITGAAGFIGFHLAKALLKKGDEVLGFDNFNPYYSVHLKKERLKNIPELKVIQGDLTDQNKLKELIDEFSPTHVVHLAAQAGVRSSLENPTLYVESNIQGFLNLLESLKLKPRVKLIYASSSSVYGIQSKEPFSEKDALETQASFYGVTKKCNELMAATYHHLYGIPVCGLRFFTVYGPFGRPDMAYYRFAKDIFSGKPIELYNYGNMKRDFTYIDDIIEGTLAAIDYPFKNEIFNLGNNEPTSLNQFIDFLEEALGKKAIRELKPMQKGDVLSTYADIEKSSRLLGFKPKTKLAEGLKRFADWFKSYEDK